MNPRTRSRACTCRSSPAKATPTSPSPTVCCLPRSATLLSPLLSQARPKANLFPMPVKPYVALSRVVLFDGHKSEDLIVGDAVPGRRSSGEFRRTPTIPAQYLVGFFLPHVRPHITLVATDQSNPMCLTTPSPRHTRTCAAPPLSGRVKQDTVPHQGDESLLRRDGAHPLFVVARRHRWRRGRPPCYLHARATIPHVPMTHQRHLLSLHWGLLGEGAEIGGKIRW